MSAGFHGPSAVNTSPNVVTTTLVFALRVPQTLTVTMFSPVVSPFPMLHHGVIIVQSISACCHGEVHRPSMFRQGFLEALIV